MGTFPAKIPADGNAQSNTERRRHNRVKVELAGRYMLEDQREYACTTVDMSPGGVLFVAPQPGATFSNVIAYIDEIGRIEGIIARRTENGFALRLLNTPAKRERLAEQLTWLASRSALGIPEGRRHDRVVPRHCRTSLQLPNGAEHQSIIVDVSRSGVALKTPVSPPLGSLATVGRTPGRIVRLFDDGVALEFTRLIPIERFDEDIVL